MKHLFYLALMTLLPLIGYSQTVSGVSPPSGNAGQTLDVTITGTNTHFTDPNGTDLYFGFGQSSSTTYINSLTINSDVSMTANITIPLSTQTGNYSVQPINSLDGIINPGTFHVNAITSAITAMTPNTATGQQTLDVTITGSDTHFADASNNTILFYMGQGSGTINVNSVTPINNTTLMANISVSNDAVTGNYNVSVTNNLDLTMYVPGGISIQGIIPPDIVSVYPNSAVPGQTINLLISAINSTYTQTTNEVDIGFGNGVGINSMDIFNDSLLLVNVTVPPNASAGYKTVMVSNPLNGPMAKAQALRVEGATVSNGQSISISPNTASAGQTLTVTITGTNTQFTQGSATSFAAYTVTPNPSVLSLEITNLNVVNDNTVTGTLTIPSDYPTIDHDISLYAAGPSYSIYNGFHIDGFEPLFAFIVPTQESDENACDGEAEIFVSGGLPPYTYNYPGLGSTNPAVSSLCEGYYEAWVVDADGEGVNLSFVIVPPNSIYTTQTYIDSIIGDTVYNNVITECTIDYNAIDSVFIESYTWVTGTDILVTWRIAYGGQSTTVTDMYTLSEFEGVSSLVLQLFCPNKSLATSLVAYDQLYFDPETASTGAENVLESTIVYPNPFNGDVTISLPAVQETTVIFTDMTGKVLKTVNSTDKLIHVETSEFAAGQYMIVLQSANATATRKIVKL